MSRILDTLRKAMSRPETAPGRTPPPKPLIFEKVSFTTPDPAAVQQAVEAKKESARLRYLLNEGAPAAGTDAETQRFLWVFAVLLGASVLAAVWLWPKGTPVPAALEIARLHERLAVRESELAAKDAEIARLKAAPPPAPEPSSGEFETAQFEIRNLKRRLAVMLEDNMKKDDEIARLSEGRLPERMPD